MTIKPDNNSIGMSAGKGLLALSPILVFLLAYLGVSITSHDFYKMPIAVAFIIAAVWAVIVSAGDFTKRINVFSKGAANPDILFMVWIFILAGAFASLAKSIGAIDATVHLALHYMPGGFIVAGLFIASCIISMAVGTSVGTVTAIVPLACQMSADTCISTAYAVAAVLCGSFFGDNLSFISDTTIAATRTQNCKMNDKFKVNIWLAGPAALVVIAIYLLQHEAGTYVATSIDDLNYWLILPYIIVIGTAMAGVNVVKVLLMGIASCLAIGMAFGFGMIDMCSSMGDGIDGMGQLITVTLLAAGLLATIEFNGGIRYLIQVMTNKINGKKGAYATVGSLVALVNLCTANNTIAIITVGSLSKSISDRFALDSRKVASVLDTCSCIIQCIIPYGAQMLLATSLAGISPMELYPYLYYPEVLAIAVVLSIIFNRR
ncbi:MAG: Na+/H+ antiporter NhaC family protein [Muribaculaceae bacterium]